MAMVDEIADYVAAQNAGTVGTDIFTHDLPPTPDVATMVAQFGMGPPIWTMTRRVAEQAGLQIQSRALTRAAAETASYGLFTLLDGIANTSIGGVFYFSISGKRSPLQLKIDQNPTRYIWYCEFAVLRAL